MKRKMRGGADSVNAPTVSGNLVLPQGIDYVKNAPMNIGMKGGMSKDATGVYGSPFFGVVPQERVQQGGMAPYPVSVGERIDAGLAMKAGTAAIDSALSQVAGLRDPNQAGGRKRKTKKAKKAKKSHRKSKKTQRKAKKSHRKSKKTQRKSKKSRKQCGGKAKKSHRKSKKSRKQRGGQMDYAESMKGGIIDADLLAKAGLHDSWKSVAAGNVM
jgi:hypothetical protein